MGTRLALALTAAALPWTQPLRFQPLPGWDTGRSGTVRQLRIGYPESSAWIANVPYRDRATSDPPQNTVHGMRRGGVVVWAVITPTRPGDSAKRIDLRLAHFRHDLCCDGTPPPYTREWDTAGRAASGRYDVIARVYFGSAPTRTMLEDADRALRALVLP